MSKDLPTITKDQWWDLFYTDENLKILRAIRQLKFGEVKIKVKDNKPVHLAATTNMQLEASLSHYRAKRRGKDTEPV